MKIVVRQIREVGEVVDIREAEVDLSIQDEDADAAGVAEFVGRIAMFVFATPETDPAPEPDPEAH